MICEQMGNEPKEDEMPADFGDFPYSVQVAISIFAIMPDVWEGMSGTYMGKNFSILPFLADVYEVDNRPQLMQFINIIGSIVMNQRSKEQKIRQKKSKTTKR